MDDQTGKHRVLAVIPARGGSKGIPEKNLQKVGGLSLLARAIVSAKQSALITDLVVSTDNEEISAEAGRYGVKVVTRPPDISDDRASSESAVIHAISDLSDREGGNGSFDITVMLQCTSPFVTTGDIDGTITPVIDGICDSCFAAADFHQFVWHQGPDGAVRPTNHDGGPRKRRQDLDPQLLEAGSVYAMRTKSFLEEKDRFCGRVRAHTVDRQRVLEIDSPSDLALARRMADIHDAASLRERIPKRIDALVFDFDGVLTDNKVRVDEHGMEAVVVSRSDGMAASILHRLEIPTLVLSSEENPVVGARCHKLRLDYRQGAGDKLAVLDAWLTSIGGELAHTIFVGNDLNDITCLDHVGYPMVTSDSHPRLLGRGYGVLSTAGGQGVMREIVDAIVSKRSDV